MKCPKCGLVLVIPRSEAARALASIVTPARVEACRANAKKPRPGGRKPRKRSLWRQLMDLPENERAVLLENARFKTKPPKKRGRPTDAERRRRLLGLSK